MKSNLNPTAPRPTRLLTSAEVAQRLGTSKSHVQYLRRTDPDFPQAVRLGNAFNSAVRFVEHEFEAWIERRMEQRPLDSDALTRRAVELAAESVRAAVEARNTSPTTA